MGIKLVQLYRTCDVTTALHADFLFYLTPYAMVEQRFQMEYNANKDSGLTIYFIFFSQRIKKQCPTELLHVFLDVLLNNKLFYLKDCLCSVVQPLYYSSVLE